MLGIRAVQRAVCLCAPSGGVILRSNFTPGGHAEGVMIFFFRPCMQIRVEWHAPSHADAEE